MPESVPRVAHECAERGHRLWLLCLPHKGPLRHEELRAHAGVSWTPHRAENLPRSGEVVGVQEVAQVDHGAEGKTRARGHQSGQQSGHARGRCRRAFPARLGSARGTPPSSDRGGRGGVSPRGS
eukprot:10193370-Alexandrium_andersonii.AAC.1